MLTEEEIDALPAGKGFDALIAEALGWTDLTGSNRGSGDYFGYPPFLPLDNKRPAPQFVPHFSASMALAWQLVRLVTDEAERKGTGPMVEIAHDGRWLVRFGRVSAVAETDALAVCRAWLKYRRQT